MSERIEDVNEDNFDQIVLRSHRSVLVDFWAEWCRPCRTLAPIVETVAKEYAGSAQVVKLNVDDNPSIAQRYGIRGIPTLILFQCGEEKERIVGAGSKELIERTIDEHVNGMSS